MLRSVPGTGSNKNDDEGRSSFGSTIKQYIMSLVGKSKRNQDYAHPTLSQSANIYDSTPKAPPGSIQQSTGAALMRNKLEERGRSTAVVSNVRGGLSPGTRLPSATRSRPINMGRERGTDNAMPTRGDSSALAAVRALKQSSSRFTRSTAEREVTSMVGGMSISNSSGGHAHLHSPQSYLPQAPSSSSSAAKSSASYHPGSSQNGWSNATVIAARAPASSSSSSGTMPHIPSASASSAGATTGAPPAGGAAKPLCCDKCDGKHETDKCPYYKKDREDHIDAKKNGWKLVGAASSLPGATLRSARVVSQPGDGSCLFHSMSYGLKDGSTASTLRREICDYIQRNPTVTICETPLSDWVKWDSGVSCADYARKMSRGCWGGGIEMACMARLKGCNVHVYEQDRKSGGYKRISAFDHPQNPERRKIVRVLYRGGVHYDALVAE